MATSTKPSYTVPLSNEILCRVENSLNVPPRISGETGPGDAQNAAGNEKGVGTKRICGFTLGSHLPSADRASLQRRKCGILPRGQSASCSRGPSARELLSHFGASSLCSEDDNLSCDLRRPTLLGDAGDAAAAKMMAAPRAKRAPCSTSSNAFDRSLATPCLPNASIQARGAREDTRPSNSASFS